MSKIDPKTHCTKPDRDEPRMICGYPLPCSQHVVRVLVIVQRKRRPAQRRGNAPKKRAR